jgi:hypothetical protein
MNHPATRSLMSIGMMAVLVAQFFSAFADNAILIIGISIVKAQGLPNLVPLLQECFAGWVERSETHLRNGFVWLCAVVAPLFSSEVRKNA